MFCRWPEPNSMDDLNVLTITADVICPLTDHGVKLASYPLTMPELVFGLLGLLAVRLSTKES